MTAPALAKQKKNLHRAYTHPVTGESVPSVTTVTGVKDKSGPLTGWAVKLTARAAVTRIAEIVAAILDNPTEALGIIKALYGTKKALAAAERDIKGARYEPVDGYSFTAAEIGDLVHDLIESHVRFGRIEFSGHARGVIEKRGVEYDDALAEVMPWMRQFLAFERRWNPEWILCEATVWNRSLGYAGTLDLAAKIGGFVYLLDAKSGNGVYDEYAMQLQALKHGEFILDKSGNEVPTPRFDRMAILHLRPEFWELHEVKNTESSWLAFRGLLQYLKQEVSDSHNWLGTRVSGSADSES